MRLERRIDETEPERLVVARAASSSPLQSGPVRPSGYDQ